MPINDDALVIGITGSFGSGCTTLKDALQSKGFNGVALSEYVHKVWKEEHPSGGIPNRTELQNIGNRLRQENDYSILAQKAFDNVNSLPGNQSQVVFDSIRHPEEAMLFRKKFQNFFLINIDASLEQRWLRLKNQYEPKGLTIKDFQNEDSRDAYEDIGFGQKVQLCVDDADISLFNDSYREPKHAQQAIIFEKFEPYLKLISGMDLRSPSPVESMMALAYNVALRSSCYKRQVGAVITDENNNVISVGYNENPSPLGSCREEYGECFRDIFKRGILQDIKNAQCPKCEQKLTDNISGDLKCKKCGFNLDKYFIRDRALSRCTALHAEETAIIRSGNNLNNCIIYTTTFPCFLCAQKIIASGIREIVYCESYPDPHSTTLFQKIRMKTGNRPMITKFEGVKARAYFRLFSLWRSQVEADINNKRGA